MKSHYSKTFFRRLHRQGVPSFTLVELLVVVAILGLLAGLLIPAITKAIASGKTGKATGNLRQIGILINSYVSENNNCLPILIDWTNLGNNWDGANPYRFWQNLVRIQAGLATNNSPEGMCLPDIFYDPAAKKSSILGAALVVMTLLCWEWVSPPPKIVRAFLDILAVPRFFQSGNSVKKSL